MSKQKAYPVNKFVKAIGYTIIFFFTKFYKVKKKMPPEVQKLKPPYLLLSNHVGYWDPFIIAYFMPDYVQYVSSDAAFRKPLQGFFLRGMGVIPKKKNIRDSKVIRDIVAVVKQGRSVGIFPEAVRNWAGKTQPMDKSIAKLIKLLGVPVVAPVLKGMNLFNPRWSPKARKTYVEVEYKLLFTKDEVEKKSMDELFVLLTEAIQYDETENQRKAMNPIRSKHKAEYINHALFLCPECRAVDSFIAAGDSFSCSSCGYDIHINTYGFFERPVSGKLHLDNLRDWFYWQEEVFQQMIIEKMNSDNDGIWMEDNGSDVHKEDEKQIMQFYDKADLRLYRDRIEVLYHNHDPFTMNYNDLQTINPQVDERLEIYYKGEALRVIGGRSGVSALKWELAVNVIWKKLGQSHKLSPYINLID
jgi:1-acyl-sn-glycerol-3-phosphate acyltransferase